MFQAVREGYWGTKIFMPLYAETKKEVKEKIKTYGEEYCEDVSDVKIEEVPFALLAR